MLYLFHKKIKNKREHECPRFPNKTLKPAFLSKISINKNTSVNNLQYYAKQPFC